MAAEKKKSMQSFFGLMQDIILNLRQMGKFRTAENYVTAQKSFMKFLNQTYMPLSGIDQDLIRRYEAYLIERGITKNTTSFYMRILRAVYNRAVEQDFTEQKYPFKYVYTGIDKTMKRAISFETIRRIKNLDLERYSSIDFARDMFMFSFYTRGMSFIDMAYLRKSDLRKGIIIYRRRKTGQQLYIKWECCMQEIITKNVSNCDSPYLLPILKPPFDNHRKQYRNKLMQVNKSLKTIAKLVGMDESLTMYVARHSWASIARSKDIPISVISEGLGHNSEATTQIYLASLDTAIIDHANYKILKDL